MAGQVNRFDAFSLQERQQSLLGVLVAVLPQLARRLPTLRPESFFVRVAVLDAHPFQPVWMPTNDAVADRAAIVLEEQTERGEIDGNQPVFDYLGEVVEVVLVTRWRLCAPETRVVRRNYMKAAICQCRHQISPLMRRGRESAEQRNLWRSLVSRFAIEQLMPIDV